MKIFNYSLHEMVPKEEKKNLFWRSRLYELCFEVIQTIWIEAVCQINQYGSGCNRRSFLHIFSSEKWVGFLANKKHTWEVIRRFSTQLKLKMKIYLVLKWCSHFSNGSSHFMFTSTDSRISIQTDNLLSFCWLFFWFTLASSLLEHKFSCIVTFLVYFFFLCVSFVFKLEAINHRC